MTDDALMEEALRYGIAPNFYGPLVCVSPSPPSYFSSRTPLGEYYDRSGVVLDASQREVLDRRMIERTPATMKFMDRWEMVEDNNGVMGASGQDLCLVGEMDPEIRDWREARWEESELARFSQFLGFPTAGLDKDILDFMEAERHCARKRGPVSSCVMKIKLVSWNVRGANDSSKRKVIKAMIRSQRADLVCIQEMKIQTMTEGVVRSLGSGRFLDWGAMGAQGSAGGILVCWDKRSLELLEMEVGNYSISCRLKNVENEVVWIFTGVYGPCNRKEREMLWEELGAIRGIWDEPWCIGGDFNVTLSQRDRSRQGSLNGAMRRFAQVVDDLALIDLPLQGGVYSLSGGRNNQTWARLDRFLVSQGWLDIFRGAVQCRLPRPTSDHFPILLKGGGMSRGPSPFRFENMWLKVDGFKELLREWWQGGERVGRASFRMAAKMKVMKEKIKVWNMDVFGRVEVNKSLALRQIEFWDRVESGRDLSEREMDMKNEAKENFKKIIINGEELVEEQEVREGIVKAFQHQLREKPGWRADLEGLHLKSLDHSEAEALEVPFTEEEIFAALMDMNGDKAPGLDGFTVAFWQACWDFAKEEIVELFKELYDQKSFTKSLNATFLVIIPKKVGLRT
ncbi:Transposon TX1 uncharacterized 149 kDa protein [Vitis vinifera]|uniref:Transposon TX1 uncharacterized 149 kDa protein n=1 Tax=Vitis vinifera TaxID=29760 RepID=A0A438BZQ7_VITVI|nr:Transposon TX1 uncharacterized 149 kDa protein [Vitis vinifera]